VLSAGAAGEAAGATGWPTGADAAVDAAGLGAAGGLGGTGFSGLMPPSHEGPEYMSAERPFDFHFSSKSAAALFGVSPLPTTSFHG
jgi:hypothetical protein